MSERVWGNIWKRKETKKEGQDLETLEQQSKIQSLGDTKLNIESEDSQMDQIMKIVFGESKTQALETAISKIKEPETVKKTENSKTPSTFKNTYKQNRNQESQEYQLRFKDPKARLTFTRYQLREYFGISKYPLPLGYLIPEVSSRFLSLLLLEKIINSLKNSSGASNKTIKPFHQENIIENENIKNLFFKSAERRNAEIFGKVGTNASKTGVNKWPNSQRVKIIDLGVGANCIFPLLGCSALNWEFVCFEKDEKALKIAQKIVDENNLNKMVKLEWNGDYEGMIIDYFHKIPFQLSKKENNEISKSTTHNEIKLLANSDHQKSQDNQNTDHNIEIEASQNRANLENISKPDFEFQGLICNPPFYPSFRDFKARKKRGFTAKPHEIIYTGGEIGFAQELIKESIQLQKRVRVFSMYLSEKCSMFALKKKISRMADNAWTFHQILYLGANRKFFLAWGFNCEE